LDVRVLRFDLVGEALHAVDAGAAGLVVGDDRDLTGPTDERGHLVRGRGRRRDIVGRCRRDRDVAVDARVESDDRDLRVLELLQERHGRLAVESREAERGWLLVVRGLEHLELLVHLGLVLWTLEGHRDVVLRGGLLGALLHRLPELVLETLRDHRDVRLARAGGRTGAAGARAWRTRRGNEHEAGGERAEPARRT